MKITIEFDHSDIIRADEVNFQGFFLMIQSFAKSLKEGEEKIFRKSVDKFAEEKKSAKNSSTEEKISEKKSAAPTINRAEIEAEIKKIALEGKEKNISAKIKELIQGYGFEKLSEVPDEKISELLGKVKAL